MRGRAGYRAIAVSLYIFFALFLLWPIAQILTTGFHAPAGGFTFRAVTLILRDPVLLRGLANAALVAIGVTAAALLLSLPLALLGARYEFRGKSLLTGLLLVPLVLPPFVGALGMRLVLGRFGPLTHLVGNPPMGVDWMGRLRILGIVIVEALGLYPIMLLNIQAALANIDPAMQQAAANLGAGKWRIFRQITWPLMRPGVFAGATLVLIWSFTELGTPLIFNFYTITPVQVFEQLTDVGQDNPVPYALVAVMLLASAALYLVGKLILGRGLGGAGTTKGQIRAEPTQLTGPKALLAALPFVAVIALAISPHIAVVLTSLSATGAWYRTILPSHWTLAHFTAALVDPLVMPSVANSLIYAGFATAIALIVGLAVAVVVVRSDLKSRGLLDALAMSPLAVPGIVLAFGYLSISIWVRSRWPSATESGGWLRWTNIQEYPVVVLVLAYAARRLPYVVRAAVAGLQQTPVDLELAAANLGASRPTVLRKITIPLIAGNLLAGALLAFCFAMLEVSDSIILAQRMEYYPITKAILELAQRLGDGLYIASALGVWAMVVLTLGILGANAAIGKRVGTIVRG